MEYLDFCSLSWHDLQTLLFPYFFAYLGFNPIIEIKWRTSPGLRNILLAFLLNHFLVSLIFTAVLGVSHLSDFVEHPKPLPNGQLAMSWPKLQMQTSVDYNAASPFLNWTLGGFNAHALHHLLPNISHVHYLNILPIFRELCKKHGITYMEMPYHEALCSHFRFLKTMGSKQHFKALHYERQAH